MRYRTGRHACMGQRVRPARRQSMVPRMVAHAVYSRAELTLASTGRVLRNPQKSNDLASALHTLSAWRTWNQRLKSGVPPQRVRKRLAIEKDEVVASLVARLGEPFEGLLHVAKATVERGEMESGDVALLRQPMHSLLPVGAPEVEVGQHEIRIRFECSPAMLDHPVVIALEIKV